jgi:hypothetical protein
VIPKSTTITPEGRRIRKTLIILGIVLILGNLFTVTVGRLLRGDRVGGPPGSSYVTTAYGAAALAELLEDEGLTVDRLRAPFTPDRLDAATTLILAEVGVSGLADPEARAVDGFIREGGWMLLAGAEPSGLLSVIAPDDGPPQWEPDGTQLATSALPGVGGIPLDGSGSFSESDGADSFLEDDDGVIVGITWDHGAGKVIWLADSTPLLNKGLAEGDSAGLVWSLIGERPVVFDEYRHGFGGDTFWQLLPDGWAGTLALLAVAGLAWMISYSRRLGPPEETTRKLQPERALYVESVAAILGRTMNIEDSIKPIRARFRRLLSTKAGLGPNPSDDELKSAAEALGLTATDVNAALDDTGDPVLAGKALSQLSSRR